MRGEEEERVHITRFVRVDEVELDRLPRDLDEALQPQDRDALRLGPAYFRQLAKKAKYRWLVELLVYLGRSDRWHLEFRGINDKPLLLYFRFSRCGCAGISLPHWDKPDKTLPEVLRTLYGVIGGFRGSMYSVDQARLRGMNDLYTLSDSFEGIKGKNRALADKAIAFWDAKDHDILCFLKGEKNRGCWFRYKTWELDLVADLKQEVGRLFKEMLD